MVKKIKLSSDDENKEIIFHPSTEKLLDEVFLFVSFILSISPELDDIELNWTAAYILHGLPALLSKNPYFIKMVKQLSKDIQQLEISDENT